LNTGDAIERCAHVDTVLFDKTGTLTLPELDVVNASSVPQDLLELAGRLALASRHPVAAAVARSAQARVPLPDVIEEAGRGVRAQFEGVEARLGSPDFCGAQREADKLVLGDPEVSAVAFRYGEKCCVLAVRQRLRSDAAEVVAMLKKRGIEVEIVSGDREEAVRHTAAELGIRVWKAGMMPSEKIARIQLLKQQKRKVMMVGDGLNDAPALAAASVSMSPASASQVSQTTADMVFLGSKLAPVILAISFSSKAYDLMKQNLFLAIGYNILAVPIAVAGYTTPLIAAAAMSGSSILVMLNALRARSPAGKELQWKF
jgi:P-type Cu2+ transporter